MTPTEQRAFDSLLQRCPAGPRIEFGVYRGSTLRQIAAHSGLTIGVDSFEGMAEPTERDYKNGQTRYPFQRFSIGPEPAHQAAPRAVLVKGFVPAVLPELEKRGYTDFAFAHLDMDHYEPTLAALRWIWPHMMPKGIICCDDAGPPEQDWLAAGAVNQFAHEIGLKPQISERKAWWTT